MFKVTVLYKHPANAEHFEKYYEETHLTLTRQMPNFSKIEFTKIESGPGGSVPEFYWMTEIYYSSLEAMQESMGTPESQAAIDDLQNFATGGVTVLLGTVKVLGS